MNATNETNELTVPEYADSLIRAWGIADPMNDPEWDEASRIHFMVDELVAYCARTSGHHPRHFNRESLERVARERLDAAKA